jgi:hypothetical protein
MVGKDVSLIVVIQELPRVSGDKWVKRHTKRKKRIVRERNLAAANA